MLQQATYKWVPLAVADWISRNDWCLAQPSQMRVIDWLFYAGAWASEPCKIWVSPSKCGWVGRSDDVKTWQVAISAWTDTQTDFNLHSNIPQRAPTPINAHQRMSHTHLVVGVTPFTIRKMDSVAPSWILCRNTCINCATVQRKGKNELITCA